MNSNAVLSSVVVAVFAAAVPSSAAAQSREHQQMAAELRILQTQAQETAMALEKALAQLREMAQIAETVKTINSRLQAIDDTVRKAMADQKGVLDGVSRDLRIIGERTQATNVRIGTLSEEVEALSSAVSAIGAAVPISSAPELLPPVGDPGTEPPPAPPAATASAPVTATKSGLSPTRLYDLAWADYTSGNYKMSAPGFQNFLSEFPKSARAHDAQFYLAESYAKMKRMTEAIAAYQTVITIYGGGEHTAEAYYQLGEAQRQTGQIEAARQSWTTVMQKYPDSNWGILARQRLDGLPPAAAAPR